MPTQRSESWIWSTASATSRLVSVFSIRSRHSPPCWRAKSQLKRNVRTPPMWRKPVGLGAIRTFTDIPLSIVGSRGIRGARLVRGRHRHGDRSHRRDRRRLRAGVHAKPADVAADEPLAEAIEAFRAKRAEHGIGGVVCHALYLCNLAAPDRTFTRSRSPPSRRPSTQEMRSKPTASSSTSAHISAQGCGPLSPARPVRSRRSSSTATATRGS